MAAQVQVQKPRVDVIKDLLYSMWHVSLTVRNVFPRFETWRRAVDIVLALVRRCGGGEGLTVHELSRLTGVHRTTLKHYVERLCVLGLVRKKFVLKSSGGGYTCTYSADVTQVLQRVVEILQGEIRQKHEFVDRVRAVLSRYESS